MTGKSHMANLLLSQQYRVNTGGLKMNGDRYLINVDRYLKIVSWAKNRYRKNQKLITWQNGTPSIYTKIENLAFNKYIK